MDKVCINCKWYYHSACNCKEVKQNISTIENDTRYISYIEEGYLSESIKENIDIKKLSHIFIESLKNQEYIKKNKDVKKINFEDDEYEIFEYIENSLYKSIQNYFEGSSESEIAIKNPNEFNCCYWE